MGGKLDFKNVFAAGTPAEMLDALDEQLTEFIQMHKRSAVGFRAIARKMAPDDPHVQGQIRYHEGASAGISHLRSFFRRLRKRREQRTDE